MPSRELNIFLLTFAAATSETKFDTSWREIFLLSRREIPDNKPQSELKLFPSTYEHFLYMLEGLLNVQQLFSKFLESLDFKENVHYSRRKNFVEKLKIPKEKLKFLSIRLIKLVHKQNKFN